MKILVLGASGMAGHIISLYFKEQGYDVTGFTRRPISFCKNILGDAMKPNEVKDAILSDDFDVVINAIGVLNQNAEDHKSMAVMLNGYLPHFIADTLKNSKTKLIHMSTDCVFAGNTGPYYEDSFPDGKIFYDRSKAIGEINDNKNLTFRNSIVGPDCNEKGIGLFNWFMTAYVDDHAVTDAVVEQLGALHNSPRGWNDRSVDHISDMLHARRFGDVILNNCAVMAVKEIVDYIENGNIKNSVNLPNVEMAISGILRLLRIIRI